MGTGLTISQAKRLAMKQAVAAVVRAALALEGADAHQVEVSIIAIAGPQPGSPKRVTFKTSRSDRLDDAIRLEDVA